MPAWLSELQRLLRDTPVSICLAGEAPPEGMVCKALRQPPVTLACPADTPGAKALLLLAARMAEAQAGSPAILTHEERWQRILSGTLSPAATDTADMPCRVLALNAPESADPLALQEMIPTRSGDRLCRMEAGWAALIQGTSASDTLEEAVQYAEALTETIAGEEGVALRVGISGICHGMDELPTAWREAQQALELGERYQTGAVCPWERMVLARFLAEQPPEVAKRYRSLIFNRKTARLLNEEMMETITLFFARDLNLSETARQLFIHRNTLVYRLDKLQRQTGLDLRRFDDAVAFRVLMLLGDGEE